MRRAGLSLPVAATVLLVGCAVPVPSRAPGPGDREVSATRPITDIERGTFAFPERAVRVSNELEGGRFAAAWMEGDSVLVLHNQPENVPINNSAWYAFKVWAGTSHTLTVRLTYDGGRHRYWPKTRRVGEDRWTPLDSSFVRYDPETRSATLRLMVGPDTLWVAGQEMRTSSFFEQWTGELAALSHVSRRRIATPPRGRPIHMLHAGSPDARRHVLFVSRQHPPEVTGTLALINFLEEMLGDSPLAREFRDRFQIHVVPLMNPDGVDLGHWRHNTGGVDLNRDWVAFHQPETRAVRDEFRRIMARSGDELWFFADFHSTNRDVFYTLERSLVTRPAGVLDRWVNHLRTALPHYDVSDSPGGLETPVSRNWAWREFQAPGLIYEVGDNTDRELIRSVAETAARGTMEILLDEARKRDREGGT